MNNQKISAFDYNYLNKTIDCSMWNFFRSILVEEEMKLFHEENRLVEQLDRVFDIVFEC